MPGLSELEHLLEQATKEPGWRPAFYRHLLDAEILALVSAPTLRGSGTLPAGTRLALAHLLREDGTWVAPFFTSPVRIQQRALQVSHCVAMTGREFFEATRGSPLHLNPNCECLSDSMAIAREDSVYAPLRGTPLHAYAWQLAGCDLGADCSSSGELMRSTCIFGGSCGAFADYRSLLRNSVLSPEDFSRVEDIERDVLLAIRSGGTHGR